MKKTILAATVIMFTVFAAKSQTPTAPAPAQPGTAQNAATPPNPDAPEIVFEQENIDYGTIEYDADGTREFKFKNTGKEPLIIYSATGSCGCTVPDPTSYKEPIKPGATGHIKVHYDTKRVGSFEKTVTVTSNAKSASKTLKIHGTVKAAPTPAGTVTSAPTSH